MDCGHLHTVVWKSTWIPMTDGIASNGCHKQEENNIVTRMCIVTEWRRKLKDTQEEFALNIVRCEQMLSIKNIHTFRIKCNREK